MNTPFFSMFGGFDFIDTNLYTAPVVSPTESKAQAHQRRVELLYTIYQTGANLLPNQEQHFTKKAKYVVAKVRKQLSRGAQLDMQLFSRGFTRWTISLRGDHLEALRACALSCRYIRFECTEYNQEFNTTYCRFVLQ